MKETQMAVVISEDQGDVQKFLQWDLDIMPHRRLIKDGMYLPKSMRQQPRFCNMQRMTIDEAFNEEEHPFRIAIVCAMWLMGFERNAAIVACKEAANENDETRKRFKVICREVFKKFKSCINVKGVNAHRADRDAINIVYKSLQQDREVADITDIIQQLHQVVDEAIETTAN